MIYEVKIKVDEKQLKEISFPENALIKPFYKKECNYVEEDWIIERAGLIDDGMIAKEVYDAYCADFIDEQIVTKGKFYKACKDLLDLEIRVMRVDDRPESCFVNKSRL